MLNSIDLFKDLKYLIVNPHSLIFTILFTFTITVPVFITIYKTKMLLLSMRNTDIESKDFGKPVIINELLFVLKALN